MVVDIVYYKFDYNKLLDFLRDNDLLESKKTNLNNFLIIRVYSSFILDGEIESFDFNYYELIMNPSNLRKAVDKMRLLSSDINKGFYSLEISSTPVFIEIYSYSLKSVGRDSKLFYKNILSTLKEG